MWKELKQLARLRRPASSTNDVNSSCLSEMGDSPEGVFFDVAMQRLNAQMDQIESIDSKAANVFLVASTVLPVTAGLITSDGRVIGDCLAAKVSLGAGLVAYLFVTISFIQAYRLTSWTYRPNLNSLEEFKEHRSEERVQRWTARQCSKSYYENKPKIADKAGYVVGRETSGLAVEVAALTLAMLIPAFF